MSVEPSNPMPLGMGSSYYYNNMDFTPMNACNGKCPIKNELEKLAQRKETLTTQLKKATSREEKKRLNHEISQLPAQVQFVCCDHERKCCFFCDEYNCFLLLLPNIKRHITEYQARRK